MDTSKEYQARVNPVYTTGKGTTGCLALAGNREAAAVMQKMDTSSLSGGDNQVPEIIKKCYAVAIEARYEISNEMIRRENKPNVIDLPSGYTPRAFVTAKEGKRYIGFDLPVVANEIGAIVKELLPDGISGLAEYHGVDATNYDSMRSKLDGVKGEVCIVTDGLLGYFNEPELVSVCDNVKRLLSEFGGSWITGDVTNEAIFGATFKTLLKGDPEILRSLSMSTASKMADVDMKKNSLYSGGSDKAIEFLNAAGFNVERVSYGDLMPPLVSMANDREAEKELREAYRGIEMWKMTLSASSAGERETKTEEVSSKDFSAELSFSQGALEISLAGRLDTITAPELLKKYEDISAGGKVSSVTIDLKETEYISSAGLRVLLIIYKALENKENFTMKNFSSEIRQIFEVTGFDQFFL